MEQWILICFVYIYNDFVPKFPSHSGHVQCFNAHLLENKKKKETLKQNPWHDTGFQEQEDRFCLNRMPNPILKE